MLKSIDVFIVHEEQDYIPVLFSYPGHTHGGQMFPLMIGAYLLNPFFAGLYSVGPSSHVYVSRGTQFWGFPMRLGAPMEITRITLMPN